MDLREHFLARYLQERTKFLEMLEGLDDGQLRARPKPHRATPAWYWWSSTRWEDWAFARLAARPQVIDGSDWPTRLHLTAEEAAGAPGVNSQEPLDSARIDDLSGRINLAALREYWEAVGASTREIIALLPDEDFDEALGGRYTQRADGTGQAVVWMVRYRSGRESDRPIKTPAVGARRGHPLIWLHLAEVSASLRGQRGSD